MDDASLGRLYERYGHLVFQRCARLLGQAADAEDAMHDVFLRAHKAPAHDRSTLLWLYRVATNCCVDRLRSRRVQGRAGSPAEEPRSDVDPDQRALMTLVLGNLDPLSCEMGLLHHLDGLTQDEIAHHCGFSRRTVGKKLERFSTEFKSRWEQAGGRA